MTALRYLRHPLAWVAVAALLCVLLFASVSVVPESAQGVVMRMGDPIGTINRFRADRGPGSDRAGLFAHLPFVENVVLVDRRPRGFELQNQEVASSDRFRFVTDASVRYRVIDPVLMVKSQGSEAGLVDAIEPALASALRVEAAVRPGVALYGQNQLGLSRAVLARAEPVVRRFGATLLSVRLERTNLPSGVTLDQAIDRMRAQRHAQAQQIAAAGDTEARSIREQADTDAARIYATSFGRDPDFYEFYRAMQSYRKTLTAGTALVLSPDSAYLREFREPR